MRPRLPFHSPASRPLHLFGAALASLVALAAPAHAKFGAPSGPGRTFTVGAGGAGGAVKTTIWYEVRGTLSRTSTPMVAVSGGPGLDHSYLLASDSWDAMSKRRPVVLYDQRGTGRSGPLRPGQSCKLDDMVADLEALRAQLGVAAIDVVGHSWGGYLAMAYAIRHPQRVRHLVLVGSAAARLADTKFLYLSLFPKEMEEIGKLGDETTREALRQYLALDFVSPARRDEFMAAFDKYQYSREVYQAIVADLEKKDLAPELAKLRVATLVMTGRYDANVAPETAWKLHKTIPGSRFEVLEMSSHMPFIEEPEAFARAVERFLDEPPAKSGAAR